MRYCSFTFMTLLLTVSPFRADEKKEQSTIDDDGKALSASLWVIEKPEAAWKQFSEEHKKSYGGNGWKKADIQFIDSSKDPAKGPKIRYSIRFFADGSDKPLSSYGSGFTLREVKGTRYFSIINKDGVEHKIDYVLKDGKLTLKGTYLPRDPKKAPFPPTPLAFDGVYTATAVKK